MNLIEELLAGLLRRRCQPLGKVFYSPASHRLPPRRVEQPDPPSLFYGWGWRKGGVTNLGRLPSIRASPTPPPAARPLPWSLLREANIGCSTIEEQ